jgi:hypothetical protein
MRVEIVDSWDILPLSARLVHARTASSTDTIKRPCHIISVCAVIG